jgi:hypothetical protein
MKKIFFITLLFISSISFSQEKSYADFFENCYKEKSSSMCVMLKIETEIQELYKQYRNTDSEDYDTENIKIQYTILKSGHFRIDVIDGNVEKFRIVIENLFLKLPKTKPVLENGKPRDAMMTSIFYLYPKKR